MSLLHQLQAIKQLPRRRAGRGYGSKHGGHTSGRGQKGQRSRSGGIVPLWFEGGQLPLIRRLPWQRGKGRLKPLHNRQEVQLTDLAKHKLEVVTPESLLAAGLVANVRDPIRLIGATTLETAIKVEGVETSQPVLKAIEKAGGSVQA